MAADSTNPTQLTDDPASDVRPAWSPDGESIIFQSDRLGNPTLFIMTSEGQSEHAIVGTRYDNYGPAFSPDGNLIAISSNRGTLVNYDIWILNRGGEEVARLTTDMASEWLPSWSPNGKWIVFQSGRSGDYELYVMKFKEDADIWQLTHDEAFDGAASWCP
jgi:TolB protein